MRPGSFIVGSFWFALVFVITYWLMFDRTFDKFTLLLIAFGLISFACTIVVLRRLNKG